MWRQGRQFMPANYRTGIGYDVHQTAAGGPLRLGGIDIPSEIHLLGHSDADVLAHAITDALLGAAALGDIGDHFPPSDPAYRGIDSMILLRRALDTVMEHGFILVNVDATVLAEAPKLGPQKQAMAHRLTEVLDLTPGRVSIKATTNEHLGCIGRGEGIAAMAVVLLEMNTNG